MRGAGELWVHSEQVEDGVVISVEDNGDDLDDEKLNELRNRLANCANHIDETTGLINVHRRIQLRYGDSYGLELSRSELGGLKVRIHLGLE